MKKKKKIGKPWGFLYILACIVLFPVFKIVYRLKMDRSGLKDIKGPALVLSQHLSHADFILSALALFPKRATFIASEHFMQYPIMRFLFKIMHVITKKMFCADVSTIVKMMRAKDEKCIMVIFPEGRQPANGISVPVTDGTAQLIKKLGINTYFMRPEGAYHCFPKWGKKNRTGPISVITQKLYDASEIPSVTIESINQKLEEAFLYNEDKLPTSIPYRTSNFAKGVDQIIWKCPVCNSEFQIEGNKNRIFCSCGFECNIDKHYHLDYSEFQDISDWYKWQTERMLEEKNHLESDVTLGAINSDGAMDTNAGTGHAFLDEKHFVLDGILFENEIHMDIPISKMGGFPITVGKHFDVYDKGKMIYVYPNHNNRESIQWVAYLDKLIANQKLS